MSVHVAFDGHICEAMRHECLWSAELKSKHRRLGVVDLVLLWITFGRDWKEKNILTPDAFVHLIRAVSIISPWTH